MLVVVPAADMRFVDPSTNHVRYETKSDGNGDYKIEIPGVVERTSISIDAMMPGFKRLVGTLMAGGDARKVDVEPGATAEANLELEPALYCRGIVVDEKGELIPSVKIGAMLVIGRGTGGVEITATGPDGSFEIFSYPLDPSGQFGDQAGKGFVTFTHPDFIDYKVDDVYSIEAEKRRDMRIVLSTGRRISGTVLDVDGKPVPNAMVEAVSDNLRKAILTDAKGHFALKGLIPGTATLTARALAIKQKISQPLTLESDKLGLEVRLKPMIIPAVLKKYEVLGMQLTDVTPELKSAYDLYQDRGALILDPGQDFERLKIGDLEEGNLFWNVGNTRIGSVREFVDRIIAETGGQSFPEYSIRVVYSFRTVEFIGTNTQYIKLTKDDIQKLQVLSDTFKADSK